MSEPEGREPLEEAYEPRDNKKHSKTVIFRKEKLSLRQREGKV